MVGVEVMGWAWVVGSLSPWSSSARLRVRVLMAGEAQTMKNVRINKT